MTTVRTSAAIAAGIVIALFSGQLGCSSFRMSNSVTDPKVDLPASQGRLINSYGDLKPDAQPGVKADMLMAGTRIPVDVSVQKSGAKFDILLRAHGETFEKEVYETGTYSFSLSEASGDTYSPALDLVRFPLHVGDHWSWKGSVASGGIQRQATATVATSSANLYNNGVSTEAVKVEVDLSLYSEGSATPATRKLIFEFVPGKGIVRREFGDASVREPADS